MYGLKITEEKNEDGTYPITIAPFLSAPFNNIDIISPYSVGADTYTGTISGDRPVILKLNRPNSAPTNYYIAQKY